MRGAAASARGRGGVLILSLCSALNLALVAAWVMDFSTMPTALGLALLIIWLLCGAWILLVGLAPFRRLEAEQNVGRTISLSKALLAIAVASALLALTRRLTGIELDEPLGHWPAQSRVIAQCLAMDGRLDDGSFCLGRR